MWDSDVAWAAPGANRDGIQIEQVGKAGQSRDQWLDDYSDNVIDNAAKVTAMMCLKFHLPVKHLSDAELKAGERGIVDHAAVSRVYKRSSHWDVGPNYPWDFFMERVKAHYNALDPSKPQEPKHDYDVAVVYDGDVDEGMARVLGWFYGWMVLPKGHAQSVKHAVLVGKAQSERDKYQNVTVIAGANRDQTAKLVAEKIKENKRVP